MDVFYEESAVNQKAEKGRKTYKVLHIISWVFLILTAIFLMVTVMMIPTCRPTESDFSDAAKYEEAMQGYAFAVINCIFNAGLTLVFASTWFVFFQIKKRININYDYVFVSGELRIAKVFNINRRKLMERIDCEEIIQIGDTDNVSYERLASTPGTKVIYYTPNAEAAEDKFFMYILINANNGKKLLVLEARELLLMNIMKFVRRSVLESDYVMQERKQQQRRV